MSRESWNFSASTTKRKPKKLINPVRVVKLSINRDKNWMGFEVSNKMQYDLEGLWSEIWHFLGEMADGEDLTLKVEDLEKEEVNNWPEFIGW